MCSSLSIWQSPYDDGSYLEDIISYYRYYRSFKPCTFVWAGCFEVFKMVLYLKEVYHHKHWVMQSSNNKGNQPIRIFIWLVFANQTYILYHKLRNTIFQCNYLCINRTYLLSQYGFTLTIYIHKETIPIMVTLNICMCIKCPGSKSKEPA